MPQADGCCAIHMRYESPDCIKPEYKMASATNEYIRPKEVFCPTSSNQKGKQKDIEEVKEQVAVFIAFHNVLKPWLKKVVDLIQYWETGTVRDFLKKESLSSTSELDPAALLRFFEFHAGLTRTEKKGVRKLRDIVRNSLSHLTEDNWTLHNFQERFRVMRDFVTSVSRSKICNGLYNLGAQDAIKSLREWEKYGMKLMARDDVDKTFLYTVERALTKALEDHKKEKPKDESDVKQLEVKSFIEELRKEVILTA